jgi:hypothetical protein
MFRKAEHYELNAWYSGKCAGVAGASTQHAADVIQWGCNRGLSQQWQVNYIDHGEYGIINRNSGKCLDVAWANVDDGADILQSGCWHGQNQQWLIRPAAHTGSAGKRFTDQAGGAPRSTYVTAP